MRDKCCYEFGFVDDGIVFKTGGSVETQFQLNNLSFDNRQETSKGEFSQVVVKMVLDKS